MTQHPILKFLSSILITIGLLLISAFHCSAPLPPQITQISTIDALLSGAYDGSMPCRDLHQYGDMGIGTFHSLDGELILYDGELYQFTDQGDVLSPPRQDTTPFAAVMPFQPDTSLKLDRTLNYPLLRMFTDSVIANPNVFCGIQVYGQFSFIKTRSVPAQEKPYLSLAEVTKNQPEFSYQSISGTLVGFRLPSYITGVNVPGYHLHFISDDRSAAGHLLEFQLDQGQIGIDVCHQIHLIIPDDHNFGRINFLKDRSQELEAVEQGTSG